MTSLASILSAGGRMLAEAGSPAGVAPAADQVLVRQYAGLFLGVLILLIILLTVTLLLLRSQRRRRRPPAPEKPLPDPWQESANRVQPFKQE